MSELSETERQEIERDVKRALLDSVYLYEALKPIYNHTRLAYEHTRKQNQELQLSNQNLRAQNRLQASLAEYYRQAADKSRKRERRKGWWRGFGIGFGTAALLTVAAI